MADFFITGGDPDSDVSEDRSENLSQENREDISEENNGGPSEDQSDNDLKDLDAYWLLRCFVNNNNDEEGDVSESCSEDVEESDDWDTMSSDNSEEHDGSRDNPDDEVDETDNREANSEGNSEDNNGGPNEDHSDNDLKDLDAFWLLRCFVNNNNDEEGDVSESCSEDVEESDDWETMSSDNSEEHDGSRDNPDDHVDETDNDLFQIINEPRMWRAPVGLSSFVNNGESEQEHSDASRDDVIVSWQYYEYWMPRSDLDHTIKLSYGKSISIVDLLTKRQITGPVEYEKNAAERGTLLALVLQNRWSSISLPEIYSDARTLLNRNLSSWEFYVLRFLRDHTIRQSERAEAKNHGLKQLANDTLVPITFMDIIHTLQKIGVNLLCQDESGSDLMMETAHKMDLTDTNVNFIEFLIKNGLDVQKNGEQAIEALCTNADYTISLPVRNLRVIKMILDAGLALSTQGKQDLLRKFTNSFLLFADETTVEIVNILSAQGCQANEALLAIEPVDYDFDLYSNKLNIDCILRIAITLLQDGAQVNSNGKFKTPCFIFIILDLARELPGHPTMLPLLNKCIERGLDISVTCNNRKNLLIAFCEKYKHEDLPDVIRLLITSGIDANYVDAAGMSSIMSLSRNNPVGRETVFNAVSTLLEFGIDAKRVDLARRTALHHFLTSSLMAGCCKFKNLELCNGSSYWKTLDLLLDASPDVVRSVDYVGVNALQAHLTNWARHPLCEDNICNSCLTTDFPAMPIDDAIASLGISNFKNVLRFLERLIVAGARVDSRFLNDKGTPLHFVCRSYSGDRLIALVELLCKSGANVNATIPSKSEGRKSKINVLELIRRENPTQVHLIVRLIEVMMPYGFKFDP